MSGFAFTEDLTGTYRRVTAAGPTVVKASPGQLMRIILGGFGSNAAVTVYDNTSASGTIIAMCREVNNVPSYLEFNCPATIGITVNLSGTSDITVIYR